MGDWNSSLSRRGFAGLVCGAAAWLKARPARAASRQRVLILLKLAGGNDGLNMVVPFADDGYRRARPAIGLGATEVLSLGEGLGLHPGMASLEESWAAGDLAIVRGIGYRPADRSHFRSMDVWETGGEPGAPRPTGWLGRVLSGTAPVEAPLGLLVVGSDPLVSVAGSELAAYAIGPEAAPPASFETSLASTPAANPALTHVLSVQRQVAMAQDGLARALAEMPALTTPFPEDSLGNRLRLVARLVAAGSPAPVILVPVAGFDTHAGQRAVHDGLLSAVGSGLSALRAALIEADCWDIATIATYSEFGRRLTENASGGTDHGTAAPHLVLGGGIAGGWRGVQPSLTDLDDLDPIPTLDFRAYLGGVATAGLGSLPDAVASALGGVQPLTLHR